MIGLREKLLVVVLMMLLVVKSEAATNIASWAFPATTGSTPTAPINADTVNYSTGLLSWKSGPTASFVARAGNGTALRLAYSGNHPEDVNGLLLTNRLNISGLQVNNLFTNIQISYDASWSGTGSITNSWQYSLNGGAFQSFRVDVLSGNSVWTTFNTSVLSTLTLTNGASLIMRDVVTGASGNSRNFNIDNLVFLGDIVAVPEPQTYVLVLFGTLMLASRLKRK